MADPIDEEKQRGPWEPPKVTEFTPDVLGALEQLRDLRGDTARIHLRMNDPSSTVVSFGELNSFLERFDQELRSAMDKLEGAAP